MNRSDLIASLASKENVLVKTASQIIALVFDGFTDTLKKGGRIEIRGFGIFTVREYGAYLGKDPRTLRKVQVGPKKLPYFKVGKDLRERVNK